MTRRLKPGNFPRHGDMHGVLPPHSWVPYPGQLIQVRAGPNYAKTGQKEASLESLYEIFAVDMWNMPQKVPHIASYADLPPATGPKLPMPEFVIVNLMVPSYAPSLWGGPSDGEGWGLVIYGRLRPAVKEAWANGTPNNAMKLMAALAQSAEGSPLRKRFKIIASVLNPDDCGFSSTTASMVKKYNGKPFLVRTTSSFFTGENYFEIAVDAHNFGKPARIGLWGFRDVFTSVVFTGAFVVEGVDDDQLPEQVLMSAKFSKPDNARVDWFPDLSVEAEAEAEAPVPRALHLDDDESTSDSNSSSSASVEQDNATMVQERAPSPAPSPILRPASSPSRVSRSLESLPTVIEHGSPEGPRHVAEPLGDLVDGSSLPVTVEGEPVEGGMLLVNIDMDYFPNRSIFWFRDGVPLDESEGTVYMPGVEDVGKRIGVTVVSNDTPKEEAYPLWESASITPSPPEINDLRIQNCFVGSDAFVEYAYFGGQEGSTRSTWQRSRNGRWEQLPGYANKNAYMCTADDLLYHIKCTLTPVRYDGLVGEPREASEMCGLSDASRNDLIESLIAGRREFPVISIDGVATAQGLFGFNHRYLWVSNDVGHKLHTGRFRPSSLLLFDPNSDVLTAFYTDKNTDKDSRFTCRVPGHRERCQLVLCFRLYMAMAMEDLVPEFLGPEVSTDWRKGKFEAHQLEMSAMKKKPKSKPNCHHRLRLALERGPPPRYGQAIWNGRDAFSEDSVRRQRQDDLENGVGYREARDVLIAVMTCDQQATTTPLEGPAAGPPAATASYRPPARPVPTLISTGHPMTPNIRGPSVRLSTTTTTHRHLEARVEALSAEVRHLQALLAGQHGTGGAGLGVNGQLQPAIRTIFLLLAVLFFTLAWQLTPATTAEL